MAMGTPPSYAVLGGLSQIANLGFDGMAVAMVGRNHPIGMIASAFLFGGLAAGAREMQMMAGVPTEMVRVVQGVIVMALAVPELLRIFRVLRRRWPRLFGRGGRSVRWSSVINILFIALHAMVPITLTAVGEIVGETAGLFNIGLEGILLLSAFTGVIGAGYGGPVVGLLIGMATGAFVGLIFSVINTYWKGNQMITGIGINLFAAGAVAYGLVVLGQPGFRLLAPENRLALIRTPVGGLSPIVFVAILLPFAIHWFLKRTRAGLILKAVGEAPESADVAGINVNRMRLLATTFGGMLAGLAGAYMSISWIGSITKGLSAGRGFISLAIVVFSGLNPILALVGGFIYGVFQSLAIWIKNTPGITLLPWQIFDMLPYIVTLLVVAGVIGRVRFPKALGEPYKRE